jgi:glucose/mannose-6-phosphate isomerase
MKYATIPYVITKSYELPACTGTQSLFLACSHSGNTEETIEATKLAYQSGATIVVITS